MTCTIRITELPEPRPVSVARPPDRTDRPAPGLAPDWWAEELAVLRALATLTETLSPWHAARCLFDQHTPHGPHTAQETR